MTLSLSASAETSREQAARLYAEGLQLLSERAYAEAADKLAQAHHVSPHAFALYHLGRAQAALDKPTLALETFRKVLEEHGAQLGEMERQEVLHLVQSQKARLASFQVIGIPAVARVSVDARTYANKDLQSGVSLDPGEHELRLVHDTGEAREFKLELAPGERRVLDLRAVEMPKAGVIWARIDCVLPGVRVSVNGASIGTTPIDRPIALGAQDRRIEFARDGYVTRTLLVLAHQKPRIVACGLEEATPTASKGWLRLQLIPGDAKVSVDGTSYQPGRQLVVGPHHVRATRGGYEPWEGTVQVQAQKPTVVPIWLKSTPDYFREQSDRRSLHRSWATGLGISGLTGLIATGVLYLYNDGQHQVWQQEREKLERDVNNGDVSENDLSRRQASNNQRAKDIQRLDQVTVAAGTLSIALVGVASVLFLTAPRLPHAQRGGHLTFYANSSSVAGAFTQDW
jgi:hypothetical protein